VFFNLARRGGTTKATRQILGQVSDALRHDQLGDALRHIDRAWRKSSADAEVIGPIYGRLLSLESRDHDVTLRLLQRVIAPDSDVVALLVQALLHLQRSSEARHELGSALGKFCLDSDGLLAYTASRVLHASDTPAPGWVGRTPSLDFIGEIRSDDSTAALQIKLDTGAEFTQPIKTAFQTGRPTFHFKLPKAPPEATLEIKARGTALLGSGCRAVPDFGLDGRASSSGRKISGWARITWLERQPVTLWVEDELGQRLDLKTTEANHFSLRSHFDIDLRQHQMLGHRIVISALLPNGEWQALPDMPLLLDAAVHMPGAKPTPLTHWNPQPATAKRRIATRRPGIDIIIPVYRGRRHSLNCIEAAIATVGDARVVVVDDATNDVELADALDELEANGQITLLRNPVNLGFVGSVNRAVTRSRTRDVALLNSDAVVFGDWLQRLQNAAYSNPHVGTVTPFTNSGSIASYPRSSQDPMSLEAASALHQLAGETHPGISVDIPVGIGFCLYIRRDCLNEVGALDASVFGKGYGEETDFCLRASRKGWSHRLAADVFVYHAGGRSFGTRQAALMDRSQRLLNIRHPGYGRFIDDFLEKDPLNPLRRKLDEHRLVTFQGKFVLLVTLAFMGGVARFVTERCRELREKGLFPLVLRPQAAGNRHRCELWTDALDVPNLLYDIPDDLPALAKVLQGLQLDAIEIQHFLDLDARVIEVVRGLATPHDIVLHDYAWICPRVTLIDGSGGYCGEPAIEVCESCVKSNGSNLREKISVSALRQRSAEWLAGARHVIAPSADAATRLSRYFPREIQVRAHASPPEPRQTPVSRTEPGGVVRVALIGAIGEHKGYEVLLACARDAKTRDLPLEFIVIGYTENDARLLKTGKVFITGPYSEGEASHLLSRERPDVAFMASVWPETWCYALDEALASGLPIMAFDLGAVADRLRQAGMGKLIALGSTPPRINDQLLELPHESSLAPSRDSDMMVTPKEKKIDNSAVKGSAQKDALSASVQMLPLTAGLYLFSVKSAAALNGKGTGALQLPAMHVGLGPGTRSDQVEFIAGPNTDGAWLFAKEDCLVTKINGVGATLVLTSVRGPGGETLSIKVERLDVRAEADAEPIAPAVAQAQPPTVPISANATKVKSKGADDAGAPLPMEIRAHIRTRGDMSFSDVPWAGRIAPGLWIESFSVKPLQRFEAQDIEYKGLTGSGFETPWLSDAAMCGTKGMAVPLVGFAIKLKPSRDAAMFDCEYSGYFKSGLTVGPVRNGTPCRSTVANDPLEGIQVHIRKRSVAATSVIKSNAVTVRGKVAPQRPIPTGPSFGRYRDSDVRVAPVAAPKKTAPKPKSDSSSKSSSPAGKAHGKASSAKRPTARS
jgi:GT2 family glycosyltransferase/glycosyltransferase involved in cell wall biosynthesis